MCLFYQFPRNPCLRPCGLSLCQVLDMYSAISQPSALSLGCVVTAMGSVLDFVMHIVQHVATHAVPKEETSPASAPLQVQHGAVPSRVLAASKTVSPYAALVV